MKNYKGKAIYNPSGRAGEYSYWACNFYVGCSNCCTYCFLRKGIGKATLGGNTPTLKKCFKDEAHALEVFEKELQANLPELREHGLFFSLTTDPMLRETIELTTIAVDICERNFVPIKILTKCVGWVGSKEYGLRTHPMNGNGAWIGFPFNKSRSRISFGFTLTGHDSLEPNASTNAERIEAMRKLHEAGFKTWASIEPVIDFESSLQMIAATQGFCDLYKIGLMSGKKYDPTEIRLFVKAVLQFEGKIYFKDGLLLQAGISRSELPDNCVDRDYNLFQNK